MRIIKQKRRMPTGYKAVYHVSKTVEERQLDDLVVKKKIREHAARKFSAPNVELGRVYWIYQRPHIAVELSSHEKVLYIIYQQAN